MATQLISIQKHPISDQITESVHARDLHSFLAVARDFSTWIRNRIKQYGFEENVDYVFAPQNGGPKKGSGGHNALECFISLDMAKELAMVERNAKGREARRYFIDCEKKYRQQNNTAVLVDKITPLFNGPDVRLQALIDTYKQLCARQNKTVHVEAMIKNYLGVRSLKPLTPDQSDRAIIMLQQLMAMESDAGWNDDQLAHIPFSMLYQLCNQAAYVHRLTNQLTSMSHAIGNTLDEVEGYMGHSMSSDPIRNRSH